jgi:hypothetical protein
MHLSLYELDEMRGEERRGEERRGEKWEKRIKSAVCAGGD